MQDTFTVVLLTFFGALSLLSCSSEKPSFHRFVSLEGAEWKRSDTLCFSIDSLAETNAYEVSLYLRTTAAQRYPFRDITLVAEQRWSNFPPLRDTIRYQLVSENGTYFGKGIATYTHTIALPPTTLQQGSAGEIRLYHLMRRASLPGIADVGLMLKKCP